MLLEHDEEVRARDRFFVEVDPTCLGLLHQLRLLLVGIRLRFSVAGLECGERYLRETPVAHVFNGDFLFVDSFQFCITPRDAECFRASLGDKCVPIRSTHKLKFLLLSFLLLLHCQAVPRPFPAIPKCLSYSHVPRPCRSRASNPSSCSCKPVQERPTMDVHGRRL